MHFGVVSPAEVARMVYEAEREAGLHAAARWKFLDEALTWREVHYHNARWRPNWTRYTGLPSAARASLDAHATDPRPHHYSLDELVHGRTHDELWNAAQRQFLAGGWMHNNLRMYWASQLLAWRFDPADAFATACYLNDRLSLDGRDAATYGGIRWAFGDGKAWRDRAVYGTAPRKTSAALMRREGVAGWVEETNARPMPTIDVPQTEAEEAEVLARYR
jgi:deoxyribodipyrimidine photolyase